MRKKVLSYLFVAILATLFIGCSSKSTELDNPKVNLSK